MSYGVLDTAPEPEFDALTELAAAILGVPITLISLVDASRQWFKSRHGLEPTETARSISFCGHVVATGTPLIVPDATLDDRFSDNPLVLGNPYVRFYGGVPLETSAGVTLGTLCAIDTVPREITGEQQRLLQLLARQVVVLLELRLGRFRLQQERQRLAAKSARLNAVINTVADGIVTIDSAGLIETFNPAAERMFGYSAEEVVGRSIGLLTPETDRIRLHQYREALVKTGQRRPAGINGEVEGLHKDGSRFPLDVAVREMAVGGRRLFTGVIRDLTERNRAADELREFKAILDETYDGILIVDPTSLRYLYANQGAVALTGYTSAELLTMTPVDLKPGLDMGALTGFLRELQAGERHARVVETTYRHKTGREIPVEVAIQRQDMPGRRPRLVFFSRDISERKRLDQLKGEFVSTVSHELRTPLTSIRGALGLVSGGVTGVLPAQAKTYVDMARANAERLGRLIDDILDIDKVSSGSMVFDLQPSGLAGIVRRSIAANESFAETYGVQLVLHGTLPSVTVVVDERRLEQVLANLISNAVKYSPAGGQVMLTIVARQNVVRVNVHDDGPGIPEGFQGRIFQRFAQADGSSTRKQGGSGLGLSISKAIVERMNGTIGFETAPGAGTTFFAEFPCLPGREDAPTVTGRPAGRVRASEGDLGAALVAQSRN